MAGTGPLAVITDNPAGCAGVSPRFHPAPVAGGTGTAAAATGDGREPSWWDRLWYNNNQLAQRALQRDEAQAAADLFEDDAWRAAAHYKAEQYEQALQDLAGQESIRADYNRANTLARLGQLQQALDNYDKVLQREPGHEDAAYNRELVEQALEQQQQQQQQQQQGQQQGQQQQQQQDQQQQQSGQQADPGQDPSQQQQQDSANEADQEQDKPSASPEKQAQDQQPESQQAEQEQARESEQEQQQATVGDDMDEQMSQQAQEQWLRRIPDDPGGLLRNKFRYQYGRQLQPGPEEQPW